VICQSRGRYEIDERGDPDEEWKTTIVLKIRRLEKTDLGEYTCSASSSMGKAEATLRVYGGWPCSIKPNEYIILWQSAKVENFYIKFTIYQNSSDNQLIIIDNDILVNAMKMKNFNYN